MNNSLLYGRRAPNGGSFANLGTNGIWWSSSVSGTGSWERELNVGYTSVCRNLAARSYGLSVRCVRNLMRYCLNCITLPESLQAMACARVA